MKNCFVTSYNGNAAADLPMYNGVRVYYNAEVLTNARCTLTTIDNTSPIHIKTINSGYEEITDISCTVNTETSLGTLFQTGVMGYIYPFSKIKAFSLNNQTGGALPTNFKVNVADLKGNSHILEVKIDRNPYQDGDIAALSNMSAVTTMWAFRSKMSGKIDNLKGLAALTAMGILEQNDVDGDFAVFVQNMRDCGRNTGTISMRQGWIKKSDGSTNKPMLYNGHSILLTKSDAGTIYWDANKSYVKKGTEVFCMGYTDSEIATNTASGGIWDGATVTKCD